MASRLGSRRRSNSRVVAVPHVAACRNSTQLIRRGGNLGRLASRRPSGRRTIYTSGGASQTMTNNGADKRVRVVLSAAFLMMRLKLQIQLTMQQGLEYPKAHKFPRSFDDIVLRTPPTVKYEGHKIFRAPGYLKAKPGRFEIRVNGDGVMDRCHFRPPGNRNMRSDWFDMGPERWMDL